MIKKNLLLATFFLFFLLRSFSQTNSEWFPVGFTASGKNVKDGVEVSYQLSSCNGKDVLFISLINHNLYSVKIEFIPSIFTTEMQWITNPSSDKRIIEIKSNGELSGGCTSSTTLVIYLKDFNLDRKNFKRLGTNEFIVSKI